MTECQNGACPSDTECCKPECTITETCVDVNAKLLELKAAGEKAAVLFTSIMKEITSLGYNVQCQRDNTLYIFKDTTTRESIGTPVAPVSSNGAN